MINQQRRDSNKHYKTYQFERANNKITQVIQCKTNQQFYNKSKSGFVRRVNVSSFSNNSKPARGQPFQDNFSIDYNNPNENPNQKFKPRRLWEAYEKQFDLFKNYNDQSQSFIDYQKNYCSFASQFGLIDKIYMQSIFLTREINQEGYYEYFIRRNGQYYLECIDDVIPVEGIHKEPIWGLSFNCPWELLLLKAWIKEKTGLGGVLQAQPFQFLYAFGLPGYSAKNIRKELQFLKRENSQIDLKRKKEEKLPLNKPQFNILAKTRSDDKIEQLGLVKNCLGYKITPIKPSKSLVSGKSTEKTIYKVRSTVPSKWIGSLSIVNKNQSLDDYNFQMHKLNLQKQFLATEEQVLSIFSKYYIARDYYKEYEKGSIFQDSYVVDNALKDTPVVFKLDVFDEGIMNINIQHKEISKRNDFIKGADRVRWPYIKYFLSKVTPDNSNIKSVIHSQKGIPGQFEPNLNKYRYYDIDFMKGYHRSINRFLKIERGEYLMYVKIQNMNKGGVPQIDYTINISSSAKFEELQVQHNMNQYQMRELVDSTIFDYSKYHGQKYVKDHIQYIYLGNSFKEIGFGFMGLELKQRQLKQSGKSQKSKNSNMISAQDSELGIRILPEKLKKLKLASYYYQQKDGTRSRLQGSKQAITMVSRLGFPKIIVLQNPNYDFQLNQEFPQQGAIEVYTMTKKK